LLIREGKEGVQVYKGIKSSLNRFDLIKLWGT